MENDLNIPYSIKIATCDNIILEVYRDKEDANAIHIAAMRSAVSRPLYVHWFLPSDFLKTDRVAITSEINYLVGLLPVGSYKDRVSITQAVNQSIEYLQQYLKTEHKEEAQTTTAIFEVKAVHKKLFQALNTISRKVWADIANRSEGLLLHSFTLEEVIRESRCCKHVYLFVGFYKGGLLLVRGELPYTDTIQLFSAREKPAKQIKERLEGIIKTTIEAGMTKQQAMVQEDRRIKEQ